MQKKWVARTESNWRSGHADPSIYKKNRYISDALRLFAKTLVLFRKSSNVVHATPNASSFDFYYVLNLKEPIWEFNSIWAFPKTGRNFFHCHRDNPFFNFLKLKQYENPIFHIYNCFDLQINIVGMLSSKQCNAKPRLTSVDHNFFGGWVGIIKPP